MSDWLRFDDPNLQLVLAGTMLVGAASALVGVFAFLRRRALVGDAVAHSVLPGIALAFVIGQSRSLAVLLPGAFISGLVALWSIDAIARNSRIKPDAATGLVLSVFFGTGILLMTWIQQSQGAAQAGLDRFLFGQAAGILPADLRLFAIVAVVLALSIAVALKEFRLMSFDPEFTRTIGLPFRTLEGLLAVLTVLAVVIGVQTVGVVLMAALLITPAAAARFWTDRLGTMLVLAALIAAAGSMIGSLISYSVPKQPTGPWIIVALSALALASMAFAPRRGWLAQRFRLAAYRRKIARENVLKAFWHATEEEGAGQLAMRESGPLLNKAMDPSPAAAPKDIPVLTEADLMERRAFAPRLLRRSLRRLVRERHLNKAGTGTGAGPAMAWRATPKGLRAGARLARIHRLWELYLTEKLRIAPDHVHDDAEAIEHLITPELEAELEAVLNHPERDPHDRAIPRFNTNGSGDAGGHSTSSNEGGRHQNDPSPKPS
jgi:manganese/zinc/iron transport system permease protein